MAFLGNQNLEKLLKNTNTIDPCNQSAIKNGAYELSLGAQVFLTDSDPQKIQTINKEEQVRISPGQFALLLTEETVNVPNDKIAFISIKASIKFKGLVNVSGFHVDPGFKGKLLFSVYNAGSYTIYLSGGTKYFPIWFADLDEKQNYVGVHENQQRIPDDLVENLAQGQMASPAALQIKINKNYDDLKKEITLLQKDHKARNYLVTVALGLALTLLLKLGVDWAFATSTINHEYELRQQRIFEDSVTHDKLIQERQLLKDIDSLKQIQKTLLPKSSG